MVAWGTVCKYCATAVHFVGLKGAKMEENMRTEEGMKTEVVAAAEVEKQAIAKLEKSLLFTRIICMVNAGLLLVALVVIVVVVGKLSPVLRVVESVRPTVDRVNSLDLNALADNVQIISDSVESIDWAMLNQKIDDLDVEAINEKIEGIDVEELEKAIENLNAASDTLKSISEKFGGIKKFGF